MVLSHPSTRAWKLIHACMLQGGSRI
jgi:hypothetical protein